MDSIYEQASKDIIMENFIDMMMSQDPKDRLHYIDIANEAMLSPAGKGKLIQQLYVDIISKSNVDFGKVPASKGNITAYEYYDPMYRSIDALNHLFGDKKVGELELTNRLHDLIITCREDFEYGYKFDVEIIKVTYCLLVSSLYDMISICIAKYTNYMKDIKGIDLTFVDTNKSNKNLIVNYVRDFIKSYDNGDWTKMMVAFKKHPDDIKILASNATAPASESVGTIAASVGAAASTTLGAINAITPWIFGTIVVFLVIRRIAYVYYYVPYKISNAIKMQAEFLQSAIKLEQDASVPALNTQKKLLEELRSVVNFIETRILKVNSTVKKKLDESNKNDYNKAELAAVSNNLELL